MNSNNNENEKDDSLEENNKREETVDDDTIEEKTVEVDVRLNCFDCGKEKEFEREITGSDTFITVSLEKFLDIKSRGHFLEQHLETEDKIFMRGKISGDYEDTIEITIDPIEDEEKIEKLKEKYW